MFGNHILSFTELEQEIEKTALENKEVRLSVFGESEDNRPLYVLEVGTGKRAVFILGGVHGRESINPAVLLQMVKDTAYLLREEDPRVTELLGEYRFLFIPLLNPDGYEIAQKGFLTIRNEDLREKAAALSIPAAEWKANARGVDLNRNFPSVFYQAESTGEYAESESESRALTALVRENENAGMLDFHSRGQVIYYYRKAMGNVYNERQLLLAQYLRNESGYELGRPEDEFAADGIGGNTVHFYSEYTKMPAITIETVPSWTEFPIPAVWQKIVYEQTKNLPLIFLMGLKTTEMEKAL